MRLLCSLTANFDQTATQFFFRDVKMNTNSLLIQKYETVEVFFVEDGWFNATLVAKNFGKDVYEWTRSEDAFNYAVALAKRLNLVDSSVVTGMVPLIKNASLDEKRELIQRFLKDCGLIKTKRGKPENGGGTWFHPKLGIKFARWLSVDFELWCDEKVEELIKQQKTPQFQFLEPIWHPQGFDFKVVPEAEDVSCKARRNTYTALLSSLGFASSRYKRQITDAVNEILMGLKARDFRHRFLIPVGSRRRTRLLFNYSLRRATNEVEVVACQRIVDEGVSDWETVFNYVVETATVVAASYAARGYRLVENVPTMRRRTTSVAV